MKKNIKVISILILVFLIVLGIYLITSKGAGAKPERHILIPKEAIWYGGLDGGSWIIINNADSTNVFKIKVYNENDGSILADALFTISKNCSDEIFAIEEIRTLITGFDGENLILNKIKNNKNCVLVKILQNTQ